MPMHRINQLVLSNILCRNLNFFDTNSLVNLDALSIIYRFNDVDGRDKLSKYIEMHPMLRRFDYIGRGQAAIILLASQCLTNLTHVGLIHPMNAGAFKAMTNIKNVRMKSSSANCDDIGALLQLVSEKDIELLEINGAFGGFGATNDVPIEVRLLKRCKKQKSLVLNSFG